MKIPIYQVDAFTSKVFKGNPAAVCPLKEWLPDEVMQKIAQENNLSETAFFINKEDSFDIRWFTPISELDLAGHTSLATPLVDIKFSTKMYCPPAMVFKSRSNFSIKCIKANSI